LLGIATLLTIDLRLLNFSQTIGIRCQFEATAVSVQHHCLALSADQAAPNPVQPCTADLCRVRVSPRGKSRHLRPCTTRQHLGAQLQQIGRGQFMGRDNGACRHIVMPGFTEQCAQHPLLEVAQVVGAFGQQ
jgi:hypothetical protein